MFANLCLQHKLLTAPEMDEKTDFSNFFWHHHSLAANSWVTSIKFRKTSTTCWMLKAFHLGNPMNPLTLSESRALRKNQLLLMYFPALQDAGEELGGRALQMFLCNSLCHCYCWQPNTPSQGCGEQHLAFAADITLLFAGIHPPHGTLRRQSLLVLIFWGNTFLPIPLRNFLGSSPIPRTWCSNGNMAIT